MSTPYYQQPPGWFQPPPLQTKRGVGYLVKAMYLTIIVMTLIILILAVVLASFPEIQSGQMDDDAFVGSIVVLGLGSLALFVVGIVTLVLYLLGLIEMHHGKYEFGAVHAKRVSTAIMLIVAMIILSIASGVISAMISFSSFSGFNSTGQIPAFDASKTIVQTTIVASVISIATTICQSLAMVYLVVELSDDKHKGYLRTGFYLSIIGAVCSTIINCFLALTQNPSTLVDLSERSVFSYMPYGFSIASFFIFLACYRDAYKRLASGELKPVPPPGYYAPPS